MTVHVSLRMCLFGFADMKETLVLTFGVDLGIHLWRPCYLIRVMKMYFCILTANVNER